MPHNVTSGLDFLCLSISKLTGFWNETCSGMRKIVPPLKAGFLNTSAGEWLSMEVIGQGLATTKV